MKNENIPYFMWDEILTKDEIKRQLIESPVERKISLMAKIMRDARLQDVWEFISVNDIVKYHNDLFQQLGWHKDLWVFYITLG